MFSVIRHNSLMFGGAGCRFLTGLTQFTSWSLPPLQRPKSFLHPHHLLLHVLDALLHGLHLLLILAQALLHGVGNSTPFILPSLAPFQFMPQAFDDPISLVNLPFESAHMLVNFCLFALAVPCFLRMRSVSISQMRTVGMRMVAITKGIWPISVSFRPGAIPEAFRTWTVSVAEGVRSIPIPLRSRAISQAFRAGTIPVSFQAWTVTVASFWMWTVGISAAFCRRSIPAIAFSFSIGQEGKAEEEAKEQGKDEGKFAYHFHGTGQMRFRG